MILRQRVAWGKLYYDLRHVYCSDFAKNGTKYGHNFNQTLYRVVNVRGVQSLRVYPAGTFL